MATVIQSRFNKAGNEPAVDAADRTRPLTAQELEWKQ
jgi:hypothetical protein